MQDDTIDQDRQLRQTRDADQARLTEQRRLDEERDQLLEQEELEARLRSHTAGRVDHGSASRHPPAEAVAARDPGHTLAFGQTSQGRSPRTATPSSASNASAGDTPGRVKSGRSSPSMLGFLVFIAAAGFGTWLALSDRGVALRHQFTAVEAQQPAEVAPAASNVAVAPLPGPAQPQVADQSLVAPTPAPEPAVAPVAALRNTGVIGEPDRSINAPAEPVVAVASIQPAPAGASGKPILELEQRLQAIETILTGIQTQLERAESARGAPTSATAPRSPVARSRRTPAANPTAQAKAAPAPAADTSANRNAGQLLAVDIWGGVPSVVVGTGDPADRRIRVLRLGDTLNGVSLLRADPATGQATFGGGPANFTMTVKEGG